MYNSIIVQRIVSGRLTEYIELIFYIIEDDKLYKIRYNKIIKIIKWT